MSGQTTQSFAVRSKFNIDAINVGDNFNETDILLSSSHLVE